MLADWTANRWMVYHLVDVSIVSTGAQSYTVGATGDIVCARPNRIQDAFYRFTGAPGAAVDYPLVQIASREDYNRIPLKTVGTWPDRFYYDASYPLGRFYPFPVPTAGSGTLFLSITQELSSFPDLTTDINLPPAYVNAIRWNGAVRVRPMYQLGDDPSIQRLAIASLNTIKQMNQQIPLLQMPSVLANRRGRYNIYSDSSW